MAAFKPCFGKCYRNPNFYTTRVPIVNSEHDCRRTCIRHRPIRTNGGKAHPLNWLHSRVKASMATVSASGSGFQLTNLGRCAVSLHAERSIVKGPHLLLIPWKMDGSSCQFPVSVWARDSKLATVFNCPCKWCASTVINRSRYHCQRSKARLYRPNDIGPPILLM